MGGETAMSYMAISQYARDHGILGPDFNTFHILLTAIDAEWLKHVAEEQKRKEAD